MQIDKQNPNRHNKLGKSTLQLWNYILILWLVRYISLKDDEWRYNHSHFHFSPNRSLKLKISTSLKIRDNTSRQRPVQKSQKNVTHSHSS